MASVLPQELLGLIVAHTGDHDTLKKCSLVSHTFLHMSRTHLFHTIFLNERRYAPSIIAFWAASPHLYPFIKIVKLYLEWTSLTTLDHLGAILKPFVSLSVQIHFHSKGASGFGFASIGEYLAHPEDQANFFNSVTRLRTEDWSLGSPLGFAAFPNLKVLSIRGPLHLQIDSGRSLFESYPPKQLLLDELELGCNISPTTLSWVEHCVIGSQLRTLKLNNGYSGAFVPDGYAKFTSLVNRVAPTLHILAFEPSPDEFVLNSYPPSFPDFPQLQKLILYCRQPTLHGSFFSWVIAVLSGLPLTNTLQEIVIDFPEFRAIFSNPFPSLSPMPEMMQQMIDDFQSQIERDRQKSEDSVSALDVLLPRFTNFQSLVVVSRVPDFFCVRLQGLVERHQLTIYPYSASLFVAL